MHLQVSSSPIGLRDEGGGVECLCDPGVELDACVVLAGQLLVPLLALLLYPGLEVCSDPCVDHVAHVGAGHLPGLPHERQRVNDVPVAHAEVEDELHGQVVVLRDSDDLDVIAVNRLENKFTKNKCPYLLLGGRQVLQVPDRDGLVGREVDHGLRHEEPVDLPLRCELGTEEPLVNDHSSLPWVAFDVSLHYKKFYIK